jgi:hypothetical protein
MMTNSNCKEPNHCKNEASALYFTKAPGEDYYKVYARYKNAPEWVPIAITEVANPGLQQVRDANRNISMGSGSYTDAHFYLRSADGNNTTTAFFTNAQGGGIQSGNTLGFVPLNLQPEGGLLTYGGDEVATREWVNDNGYITGETDPVYTASVPNQMMYKGLIPASVDLNAYTTTGKYYQNSDAYAASGTNYPAPNAGMLEVIANGASGDVTFQTYHIGDPYQVVMFTRFYRGGIWSIWTRFANAGDTVVHGINFSPYMTTVPQNSILYHYGNEPDAPIAETGYSINGSVGGVSSVQLYIATGAATGFNPDGFFWRGNNSGGPGWPGPWRQVASREWVEAQGYTSAADIASGTYTPTFGNFTGPVDSVSGSCMYTRSGSIVTVNGFLDITLSGPGTDVGNFEISLPVASDFSSAGDCAGMGTGLLATSSGILIIANPTTNNAIVNFERSLETGIVKITISFMYKIA